MTAMNITHPKSTTVSKRLISLLELRSKHSSYQELHPCLRNLFDIDLLPVGKREYVRWQYMASRLDLAEKTVLDIGANTGYFSMAAIEANARFVTAMEGNRAHAEFIKETAQLLGWQERLLSANNYFEFDPYGSSEFDVTFCLNVLHHMGDDFGNQTLSMEQAQQNIMQCLINLATHTRHCWFQLGFNWKGDRNRPLFPTGLKRELIDFVESACRGHWFIEKLAIYNPETGVYEDSREELLERFDSVGEFLNRPLFLLKRLS
jgi:SAM-dependent methyltransferase